jgi:hypothetical protein
MVGCKNRFSKPVVVRGPLESWVEQRFSAASKCDLQLSLQPLRHLPWLPKNQIKHGRD